MSVQPVIFDTPFTYQTSPYWYCYYPFDIVARAERIRCSHFIQSTGVNLHIDVYERSEPNAPVFIFNHGGGGYSGLFVSLALAFYDLGYTVLLPDQKGQGRTSIEKVKGDFTLDEAAQNIADVAQWARHRYAGPIFMGGGSLGSGITYHAITKGAPVEAIATLQLYDFGDPKTALYLSRFNVLAGIPGVPWIIQFFIGLLEKLFPKLRIPYRPIARWHNMLDERDLSTGFFKKWSNDPYTLKSLTVHALASLFKSPAKQSMEYNQIPFLVINTMRDKMISPEVTIQSYERLAGPKKYVELDWGHFSLCPEFLQDFVTLADSWFRQYMPANYHT